MTISWSDYPRIILESSLYWRKQFSDFSTVLLNSEFRGRRTIFGVVQGIVMDVSCVKRINYENDFSWQAQYLVMLERHFSWQAQHFVKF